MVHRILVKTFPCSYDKPIEDRGFTVDDTIIWVEINQRTRAVTGRERQIVIGTIKPAQQGMAGLGYVFITPKTCNV